MKHLPSNAESRCLFLYPGTANHSPDTDSFLPGDGKTSPESVPAAEADTLAMRAAPESRNGLDHAIGGKAMPLTHPKPLWSISHPCLFVFTPLTPINTILPQTSPRLPCRTSTHPSRISSNIDLINETSLTSSSVSTSVCPQQTTHISDSGCRSMSYHFL